MTGAIMEVENDKPPRQQDTLYLVNKKYAQIVESRPSRN
ncbi:MAG: hypothetical protein JWM88_2387 [Verrucomicrobia bacterium]|nr:hypothetical protein [Verrucomicrobiota bacterium]